jgi:uncharacterized protein (DUF433 family)
MTETGPTSAELISRSDEVLGGTPVFRDTRVPVRTLVDYLAAGQSLDEFLEDFPTVPREDAVGVLELAAALVLH